MKSRREESQSMPRGREGRAQCFNVGHDAAISSSDKALVGSADYALSVDGSRVLVFRADGFGHSEGFFNDFGLKDVWPYRM